LIVYVETNFLLELAYLQPTADHCQRLLDMAEQHQFELVISSFALIEARLAWQRNVKRRNQLEAAVRKEVRELSRSRPLIDMPAQSQAFVAALIDTAQQDRVRLEAAIVSVTTVGTVTPPDPAALARAYLIEQRVDLSPQDAVIYASVLQHIEGRAVDEKVFVTTNKDDFSVVENELAGLGCKLLFAFDAAEGYVRSRIAG
jgi:predicted nucleic acid-binding protein